MNHYKSDKNVFNSGEISTKTLKSQPFSQEKEVKVSCVKNPLCINSFHKLENPKQENRESINNAGKLKHQRVDKNEQKSEFSIISATQVKVNNKKYDTLGSKNSLYNQFKQEEHIQKLQLDVELLENNKAKLQQKLEELAEQNSQNVSELQTKQQELRKLQKAKDVMQEKFEDQLAQLQEQCITVKQSLSYKMMQVQKEKDCLSEKFLTQIKSYQKKTEAQEKSEEKLCADYRILQNQFQQIQNNYSQQSQLVRDLEEKCLAAAQKGISDCASISVQLENSEAKHKAYSLELDKQIKILQNQNISLQDEVTDLKREQETLKSENIRYQSDVELIKSQNANLCEQVQEQKLIQAKQNAQEQSLLAQIEEHKGLLGQLQETLLAERKDWERKIEQKEVRKNTELEEQKSVFRQKLEDLKSQLKVAQQKESQLQQELQTNKEQELQSLSIIQNLSNESNLFKQEKAKFLTELEQQNVQLSFIESEYEHKLTQLNNELEQKSSSNQLYSYELEKLQVEIKSLNSTANKQSCDFKQILLFQSKTLEQKFLSDKNEEVQRSVKGVVQKLKEELIQKETDYIKLQNEYFLLKQSLEKREENQENQEKPHLLLSETNLRLQIQQLQIQKETLETEVSNLVQFQQDQQAKIDHSIKQYEIHQKSLFMLQSQISQLQANIHNIKQSECLSELIEVKQLHSRHLQKNDELKESNQLLESELLEKENFFQTQIERLKAEWLSQERIQKKQFEQMNVQWAQKERLQTIEIEELKKALAECVTEEKVRSVKLDKLTKELAEQRENSEVKTKKIEELTEELSQKQKQLKTNQEANGKNFDDENQLDVLVQELQNQLLLEQQEKTDLKQKLFIYTTLQNDEQLIELKLPLFSEENYRSQDQINQYKSEAENLKHQVKELQYQLKQYQTQTSPITNQLTPNVIENASFASFKENNLSNSECKQEFQNSQIVSNSHQSEILNKGQRMQMLEKSMSLSFAPKPEQRKAISTKTMRSKRESKDMINKLKNYGIVNSSLMCLRKDYQTLSFGLNLAQSQAKNVTDFDSQEDSTILQQQELEQQEPQQQEPQQQELQQQKHNNTKF